MTCCYRGTYCNICRSDISPCLSSDPTLTTHNVVEIMKGVKHYDCYSVLSVSRSEWAWFTNDDSQSEEQECEALIAHVLSTHPCMSWKRIAHGLQQHGYSEAAAEVTRKYVKGQLRASSVYKVCVCARNRLTSIALSIDL